MYMGNTIHTNEILFCLFLLAFYNYNCDITYFITVVDIKSISVIHLQLHLLQNTSYNSCFGRSYLAIDGILLMKAIFLSPFLCLKISIFVAVSGNNAVV